VEFNRNCSGTGRSLVALRGEVVVEEAAHGKGVEASGVA